MKIIFDETVPQNLRSLIDGHTVVSGLVSRLVRFQERRLTRRGGSSRLQFIHHGKTGIGGIIAAIDAAIPGSYAGVETPPT
jgi:hypothetical protein